MALKKSKLKEIPQRNKDVVFGYAKECAVKYTLFIPETITYLCLIFLNENKDEFDAKNPDNLLIINGDTIAINRIFRVKFYFMNVDVRAYLGNIVCGGIHIWRFKLNYWCSNSDLIGLIKNDSNLSIKQAKHWYGFNSHFGRLLNDKSPKEDINYIKKYHGECKSFDIIEMKIDFYKLCLSYKINKVDHGKAYDIDPGEYRACIWIFSAKSNYTLMSYHKIY